MSREEDIPHDGPLCDLMWSDPNSDDPFKDYEVSPRGAGYYFGQNITKQFLHNNNLEEIIRAHQLSHDGYIEHHEKKCLTVFSAPNYLLRSGNRGAFIMMDINGQKEVVKFDQNPDRFDEPRVETRVPDYFL